MSGTVSWKDSDGLQGGHSRAQSRFADEPIGSDANGRVPERNIEYRGSEEPYTMLERLEVEARILWQLSVNVHESLTYILGSTSAMPGRE